MSSIPPNAGTIENPKVIHGEMQTVFADKLTAFSVSAGVSKLTFAMEVDPTTVKPFMTVVMPTNALLEALEFILNSTKENVELRNVVTTHLDVLKKKFE